MSIIQEAKRTLKYIGSYNKFIDDLNENREKKELTISNLDLTKREDYKLMLQVILRNRTNDEFYGIVDGLFNALDRAKTKEEKESLHNLASMIMGIGESNRGIDWS